MDMSLSQFLSFSIYDYVSVSVLVSVSLSLSRSISVQAVPHVSHDANPRNSLCVCSQLGPSGAQDTQALRFSMHERFSRGGQRVASRP